MDQVSEIRERIDIVALISEFISLKQAGRNFKAQCPFHSEKSPSFVVSSERQIWHCFGCGKGGDCYSFLMEYERVEFPEALRILAKRAGVTLESNKFDSEVATQKEQIYRINALTAEYYHYILTKHKVGKIALKYILDRGISEKVIKTFQLGFAPRSGDALCSYLVQKKKYVPDLLFSSGLAYLRAQEPFDFFRGRIMFPLIDQRDNVVGFSGRILDDDASISKYVNTRDTIVYHKRDSLFGLNNTKEEIKKENEVLLVEGEFDVLTCFQHGVGNVVGVKGTALTENQVNLLSRFAKKIIMCFDEDKAGQEAIKRSLPIFEKKGINVGVVIIPNGKDPDEAIKNSEAIFKKAVKENIGIYEYLFNQVINNFSSIIPEGKKVIADTLLPIFSGIENEIIKEHYLKKLSQTLETTYESILREMARLVKKEKVIAKKIPVELDKKPRDEVLEEYLLALILQSSDVKKMFDTAKEHIADLIKKDSSCQKIIDSLGSYLEKNETFDSKDFGYKLAKELYDSYNTSILFPLSDFANSDIEIREVATTASNLRELYLKEGIKKLAEDIKKAEANGNEESASKLKDEYAQFVTKLKKL